MPTRPPKQDRPTRTQTPKDRAAEEHAVELDASINEEADRHRRIAIAAYYRAERRGFSPGEEMEDWLAAEAAVREVAEKP
jgi:hypothetical protein